MPHSNQEGGKENDNKDENKNKTTNGGCIIGAASVFYVKRVRLITPKVWF